MRIKNETDRATRQFIEMMHGLGWSEHTVRAYERGVMFFVRWLVKETAIEAWREELCRWKISPATC